MTKHALVIAAFLLLCGCSIGEPIQLSSCETSDPGPNCPPKETCAGQCVVVPPLGGWDLPALLWFGPALEAPECPADRAPMKGYEGYADPIDPPTCSPSACTCEPPAGECGLPSVLTASTDPTCPDDDALAMHTDFSGLAPPGDCNGNTSIPAGYGSVTVEPLTLTETGCKPSGPPPPTEGAPAWKTFARACRGSASPCLDPSMTCVPAVPATPPGFSQCIFKNGEHACPDEYPTQHVFYDEITGSRGCSACSCAAPDGGVCSATVELFKDGMCTMFDASGYVASNMLGCIPIPGNNLGGKKVTALSYQPGTCEPIGGEPIDSIELKGPSTFCCQE
jgi:hypothetical protein